MRPRTEILGEGRVRRYAHRGSPTIQAFLHYLRSEGVDFVPKPLRLRGDREELTYLPGSCYKPTQTRPASAWDEHYLEDLGKAVRLCHDASVGFLALHHGACWFPFPEPCQAPEVI